MSENFNQEIPPLTDTQRDILGEIGNISMGTAATTMSTLLNQKVSITTPIVKTMTWEEISSFYDRPCVGVKIDYIKGLKGSNVLILKNIDVKMITDLMVGGSGILEPDIDDSLTEIDLSAICEAMNQMVGSSSTSLTSFVNERKIDINTPNALQIDFSDEEFAVKLGFTEFPVVAITFKMQIGDLLDSSIIQVFPKEFAQTLVQRLEANFSEVEGIAEDFYDVTKDVNESLGPANVDSFLNNQTVPNRQNNNFSMPSNMANSPQGQQMSGGINIGGRMDTGQNSYNSNIGVAPVQFQNFDQTSITQQKENINILMDVPLEVTVELGRTSKRIKEILEFSPGTIIELDKLAGEPIDILVNGKHVAKGEVVVIDENFGIRVTSIVSPEHRI
ncbi:MAG: flagellar motor switch phosphatase FliY [Defluviitaleaceae bacterium]|nr:flagellar motor switch phosphatase FliY [Defluviitaleaceae bacterium]